MRGSDPLSLTLSRSGFSPIQYARRKVWGVVGNGECIPFFVPDVSNRHGGIQIKGGLGVLVPAFESYWAHLVRKHDPKLAQRDDFLVAIYMTNVSMFDDPPVFNGGLDAPEMDLEVGGWLASVREFLFGMPRSVEQLNECCHCGYINGVELWKFFGHPVKSRFFAEWASQFDLTGIASTFGRQNLSRVQPYEVLWNSYFGGALD